MNYIIKKARKDFKKLGWRKYLIIAVISLSLGGGLAANYMITGAMPMINKYFENANRGDYTYQLSETTWITQTDLDGLKDVEGVDDFTGRLFWPTHIQLEGQNDWKYVLLVGLDENQASPNIYKYEIDSGRNYNPKNNNISAIIDQTFASKNGIQNNDLLKITGLNNATINITGTFNSPEFLTMTSSPEFVFPIEGSMTVIYLSETTLKNYIVQYYELYNSTVQEDLTSTISFFKSFDYNNIAVTFKPGIDIEAGNNAVKSYLENNLKITIDKDEKFEDSYVYTYIKADLGESGQYMMIMLVFLVLIGILVVFVIFNRYVKAQKRELGILEALGYSKKDLYQYFTYNILFISIITIPLSIFIGYILGYVLILEIMTEMAHTSSGFSFVFLPETIYLGLIFGFTMIFISTYLPIRKIRKMDIASLIYGKEEVKYRIKRSIKKDKKRIKNVSLKLTKRNAFRNKGRLSFSLLAITFSLLIVGSTEGMLDSMFTGIQNTFDKTEKWDLNVQFQTPINSSQSNSQEKAITGMTEVKEANTYVKGIAQAEGTKNLSIYILGIDFQDNNIHKFKWQSKIRENIYPLASNEIVISSVHALKLDKKVGDILTIRNATNDINELKIVGIHEDLMLLGYISKLSACGLFYENGNYTDGIYLILQDSANIDQVTQDIYNIGNIGTIFNAKELQGAMRNFLNNYLIIFEMMILYVIVVSFAIVLYNSVMNIYDKNYEYGILRSLGYKKGKIFKYICLENILQGIIPIIFALIFVYPLTEQLATMYQDEFPIQTYIGLPTILLLIFPPILLYVLGSFIALRTVFKQNLYEQVQTSYVG